MKAHQKALNKKKGGYTDEKGIYHRTEAEQKERIKHWPKSTHKMTKEETTHFLGDNSSSFRG